MLNSPKETSSSFAAWNILIPITLVILAACVWLAPLFDHTVSASAIQKIFILGSPDIFKPEPVEQARYLFAIILFPLLYLFLILWTPKLLTYKITPIVMQVLLFGFMIFNGWTTQPNLPLIGITGLLAVILALAVPRIILKFSEKFVIPDFLENIIPILCLGYTLGLLLPGLVTSIAHAPAGIQFHYSFVANEFEAILNGRMPLGDFYPQYQILLPLLLAPLFKIIGVTYTTLSSVLVVLQGIVLLTGYTVLYRLTRKHLYTALLFLPFAASSVFPTSVDMPGGFINNTFTYYALMPVRYLGPFLVMFLLSGYLSKPTNKRMILLLVIAIMGALNNFDFGFPALAAAVLSVLFASGPTRLPNRQALFHLAKFFMLSLLGVLIIFSGIVLLKSGRFPHFDKLFLYQKIFVYYGFNMLPMPQFGLHWLMYFTYMACLALAIRGLLFTSTLLQQDRLYYGLMLFLGILGPGTMMYYVGRSHPVIIVALFPVWTLSLMLLIAYATRKIFFNINQDPSLHSSFHTILPVINWLPYGALAIAYVVMVFNMRFFPNLSQEWARLTARDNAFTDWKNEQVSYIQAHTSSNEPLGILMPYGWELANAAHRKNVFPFAEFESLLIRKQLDMTVKAFNRHHVKTVYGLMSEPIYIALAKEGFTCTPVPHRYAIHNVTVYYECKR